MTNDKKLCSHCNGRGRLPLWAAFAGICSTCGGTGKVPAGPCWPNTVEEAVDVLLKKMGSDDINTIKEMPKAGEMIEFHHTLGRWVRNNFGLWQDNQALLHACGKQHPDDASGVILEALWKKIQEDK